MKRQLTLGQKLTVLISLVVVIQAGIVLGVFFLYFNPRMQEHTFDVVKRGAEATAEVYANKWNYYIQIGATSDEDKAALKERISAPLKQSASAVALGVFAVKDEVDKTSKKLIAQRDFALLAGETKSSVRDLNLSAVFKNKMNPNKKQSVIMGDYVIAGCPVAVEDMAIGYLIYVETLRDYNQYQRTVFWGILGAFVVGLVAVVVFVLWIGTVSARPLNRIANTAAKIADGDLTEIGAVEKGVAETNILSVSVQNMAIALREQVVLIKDLTLNASDVSREVAKGMAHLAASAAEQAAAVAQTASTVEEMEKTGRSVASAANQIVEAAEKSAEGSNRGRQAVDTASGVIFRIKEDSQEISQRSKMLLSNVEEIGNIINSVNAISEQSKILAVNASIEAAKAGEFGAGFAVVAQEVKDLAGQSKEATEQITRTLTSIRQAIEGMVETAESGEARTVEGVSSIANAGAIVNDLSEAIREASGIANVIDTSVNQQSLGLSQIAAAIEEINISASENQDISRKIEKSTQKMSESLEELSKMVDVWQTGERSVKPAEVQETETKSKDDGAK